MINYSGNAQKSKCGLFQLFYVTRGHSRHTNNMLTFKALNICLLDEILLMFSIILVQLKDAIAVTTLLFLLYLFYFGFIAVVYLYYRHRYISCLHYPDLSLQIDDAYDASYYIFKLYGTNIVTAFFNLMSSDVLN